MLTAAENELLCRVEGDAAMGRLMRRHWVPALLSEQVARADGAPVRVQLFGEKLVAFRDSDGKLGLLGEFCPHRKASLAFGRNEECGLRCLYHGWKFDTEGNVIDMPSEPKASALPEKAKHLSYPTREAGGFVWTYMGPPDTMPEFEAPPWAPHDQARVAIAKVELPCNWAQIMEGQIDSAHSSTCIPRTCARPGARPQPGAITGFVPRPTRTRASRSSSPITACATPRSGVRS